MHKYYNNNNCWWLVYVLPFHWQDNSTNRDECEMKPKKERKRNWENELIWPKAKKKKLRIQIRTINDSDRMTPLLSAKRSLLCFAHFRGRAIEADNVSKMLDRGMILQNTVTNSVMLWGLQHPLSTVWMMHLVFDGDRYELETHRKCRSFYFCFCARCRCKILANYHAEHL